MDSEALDEVMRAVRSLLDALEKAGMEFADVPVLLEVMEEARQESVKRLLESW